MHVPAYAHLGKLFFVVILHFLYSCVRAFVLFFDCCSRKSPHFVPTFTYFSCAECNEIWTFASPMPTITSCTFYFLIVDIYSIRLVIMFKFITKVAKPVITFARSLKFASKKFSGCMTLKRWWLKWLIELWLCQLPIYTLMLKDLLALWLSFN